MDGGIGGRIVPLQCVIKRTGKHRVRTGLVQAVPADPVQRGGERARAGAAKANTKDADPFSVPAISSATITTTTTTTGPLPGAPTPEDHSSANQQRKLLSCSATVQYYSSIYYIQ